MALEEDISALTELVQGMLAESGEQTGGLLPVPLTPT